MTKGAILTASPKPCVSPPWPVLALGAGASLLTLRMLSDDLPVNQWLSAVLSPHGVEQTIFAYSSLPRIAISLLAGAALALLASCFSRCCVIL